MIEKIIIVSVCFTAYLAFQRSWLFLASLIVVVLCIYEEVTRSKIQKNHDAKTVGRLKSRLKSLPYSEYDFNKQFLSVMGSQKLRALRFEQKQNITSPLINYINGLRKTSFVQSHQVSGPKIRLFGGSTIDCQEVPDDYTVASQLQLRFNSSPLLNNFEVINYGVSGATLNSNFLHFNQIDVLKGDICIFFFGANESFSTEFFKTKRRLSWVPKFKQAFEFSKKHQLITLYRLFEKYIEFDDSSPLIAKKVQDVEKTFSSIDSLCRSKDAKFIAVLQPILHTRAPLTQFDEASLYYFPKTRFNDRLFLFEKFKNALKPQSFFFDGREIFNQTNLDVYLDWVHTNYQGNKIIADYFYSIIQQQLLKGQVLID